MNEQILDDRGWITKIRRMLPSRLARSLRDGSQWAFAMLPDNLKYRLASMFQSGRYPYKLVRRGDRVVQVGAPRDILLGGRSRAIHFARAVGPTGHVLVIEPDAKSVAALQSFLVKHKLSNRLTLVNLGAWKEKGRLEFRLNPTHPAANRIASLARGEQGAPDSVLDTDCEITAIDVDSLGNILQQHGFDNPALISITTNGAEKDILDGLWTAGERFVPRYVSLGPPNESNVRIMKDHGFRWVAWDDRGHLFEREK